MPQHSGQFGPGSEGRERHRQGSDPGDRQPRHHPFRPIPVENPDSGALPDASREQPAGERRAPSIRLPKGKTEIDSDDEGITRRLPAKDQRFRDSGRQWIEGIRPHFGHLFDESVKHQLKQSVVRQPMTMLECPASVARPSG